ncbi:DUF4175 domain-containing protein [Ponticaulis profundi]|uniref:DUF4175 domain-containing protein n=1 Tax=Ponticaulis profundi TaxID=2665222 RepID=A0ABW1S8F3_9PROT
MDNILKHPELRARIARTKARLSRLAWFDAFALPFGLALVFLILAVIGTFNALPMAPRAIVLYGLFAAFIGLLVFGWQRLKLPGDKAAKTALDETHPQRPLSGLEDYPAQTNAETRAIWKAHRQSLAQQALQLKSPGFRKAWKRRDPLALRFVVPVIFLALLGLNFTKAPSRFATAFSPDIGAVFGAQNLDISAWLTPPEYTGEAPVFLTSSTQGANVPAGSTLTFRVHGPATPELKRRATSEQNLQGPKSLKLKRQKDGSFEVSLPVTAPQTIALHFWGKRAEWDIQTAADQVPTIQFASDPSPTSDDKMTFDWSAEDDYGLASVELRIQPHEDSGVSTDASDTLPLELPVAFARSADETASLDLTRHKWAGLPVHLTLIATDSAGQSQESETLPFILPEKLFLEPLAKSSQEVRLTVLREEEGYISAASADATTSPSDINGFGDRLENAPEGYQQAALMLDAVTYRPDIFIDDYAIYMGLRRSFDMLKFARAKDDVEPIDDLLWSIALRAEFGTLADAARRLEAARRALERALRDGASEEEIQRLMQAFRDAAEEYIAARMAEALMNGDQSGSGGGGEMPDTMLQGQDLEDMLAALQDLTETGATDAARQLLDDVANLLNNLQFTQGQNGDGGMPGQEGQEGDEDASPEEKALQGALDRLAEILEEQRRLNDDTMQERFGSGESEDGIPRLFDDPNSNNIFGDENSEQDRGPVPGEPGEDGEETDSRSLAERQSDLRDQLEAFIENGDENGEGMAALSDEQLEDAERALRRAERALQQGDLDAAQWNQDRAVQSMRDAAGGLAEELDERRSARRGENGEDTINESDPLGRTAGGARPNGDDEETIPDEIDRQRARDILDDLRRRLNESDSEEEREYLRRLLDRF